MIFTHFQIVVLLSSLLGTNLPLIADNSKKWKKRKRDDDEYVYAEEELVDVGDGGKSFCSYQGNE